MTDHATRARSILARLYFYAPEYWTGETDEAGLREKAQRQQEDIDEIVTALDQAAQEAKSLTHDTVDSIGRNLNSRCENGCGTAARELLMQAFQVEPQAAQPVWSKDKPTAPGWYWWRTEGESGWRIEITQVCLMVWNEHSTEAKLWCAWGWIDQLGGEWAPCVIPRERG